MWKKKRQLVMCFCVFCMMFAVILPTLGAEYDYIYITNPFLKKIPVAVPYFQTAAKSEKDTELAQKSTDLVVETLMFTSYFKLVDRDLYLLDDQFPGVDPDNVRYANWRTIGADLLITGSAAVNEGVLQLDIRLFDTVRGENLISKRYTGTEKQYREMVRLFCSHVVFHLTGKESIFNTKILFVSDSTGNKELFLCDFDGDNITQFTRNQDIALFPSWSWDGRWVAYTSYKNGQPDLFIRHIRENRGAVVTKPGINTTPAWVPNKFALAATQSFSGDPEIYMLTGDGKVIRQLTHSRDIDTSPTFSPDGKQMAFVSKRSGSPQIHIMTIDGGRTRRLTFSGNNNTQPDWSPAGDKICYTAMASGQTDIMVINSDGTGLRRLTENNGNNESASWSPDGNLIVFSSTREGRSKLYVMTAFGTDQRRLLDMPGAQTNPKWSPRLVPN